MATSGPAVREILDDGLRYEKAGMMDRALEQYLSALEHARDPSLVSESLRRQAHVYRIRCDWEEAIDAARRSAAAAHSAQSPPLLAEAWNAEAAVHQSRGDFDAAVVLYRQMLDAVQVGRIRGVALQNMAAICAMQGKQDEAEHYFRDAHAAFHAAHDTWGMAHVLHNLGCMALDRGDPDTAEATLHEATTLAREIQDLELLALARLNRAEALLARGELEKAELEASASLGHFVSAGNDYRRAECLLVLGDVAMVKEQPESARRSYQAALDTADAVGAKVIREQVTTRLADLPPDAPPPV